MPPKETDSIVHIPPRRNPPPPGVLERMDKATTLEELFDAANEWDECPDESYEEILMRIDANRGPHQRKLFPPEMKGITW